MLTEATSARSKVGSKTLASLVMQIQTAKQAASETGVGHQLQAVQTKLRWPTTSADDDSLFSMPSYRSSNQAIPGLKSALVSILA